VMFDEDTSQGAPSICDDEAKAPRDERRTPAPWRSADQATPTMTFAMRLITVLWPKSFFVREARLYPKSRSPPAIPAPFHRPLHQRHTSVRTLAAEMEPAKG